MKRIFDRIPNDKIQHLEPHRSAILFHIFHNFFSGSICMFIYVYGLIYMWLNVRLQ